MEDKKTVDDVPIVREFPDVFPEDFSGVPLERQVEFQIDLISGTVPNSQGALSLSTSEDT